MGDLFKYDKQYTKRYVITGACALARNGLVYANAEHLELQSCVLDVPVLRTVPCNFYYNPEIDWEYELTPSVTNPLLLLPSKERALVECIKHLDWVDEGFLIEALKDYLWRFYDADGEKLYKAAEHFDVSKEAIDYWLDEARNDEDD